MIASVRGWVASIAGISILMAMLDAITPNNSAGRFLGLCGSLILMFVVLSPLKGLGFIEDELTAWKYDFEIEEYVERAVEENNNLEKLIIENKISE